MATDSGFNNQKKKGISQFETVHNLSSSSFGKATFTKLLYEITSPTTVISVTDIIGSNGQVEFWNIELLDHGASVGNVAKFVDGLLTNFEFSVEQVIDVDNFYILPVSNTRPDLDNCQILGWITSKATFDGTTQVSIVPPSAADSQSKGIASLDFAVTNVTGSAYVQLISATSGDVRNMQIFMSSGDPLYLAFGAAASEVDKLIVIPGGNGVIDFFIPSGTRVSLKKMTAGTVSEGVILVNLLG